MNINYSIIDGNIKGDFATGGVTAIVAILMVFLVLLLIIFLTELASKMINSAVKEEAAAPAVEKAAPAPAPVASTPLDINDTDATVAALVASIDYREETGMNIRVVSVKKVG